MFQTMLKAKGIPLVGLPFRLAFEALHFLSYHLLEIGLPSPSGLV